MSDEGAIDAEPKEQPPASSRALRRERRRKLTQDAWNLPNILTYARVVMIPGVLYLLDRGTKRDCVFASVVSALAPITALLDGVLARRLGLLRVSGQFL